MKVFKFANLLFVVLLLSCGKSSKSNSYENNPFGEYSTSESEEDDYSEEETQMVTCPMCNGTGIFDFMPGDMMAPKQTCGACNGTGACDVNTAQQVKQAKAQIDAMLRGGGDTGGYSSGGSGRAAYQIEYELNKAYELLESMEEAYANSEGVVVRAQYPRMIADQKERIRQLEAELRNAQ
jgi:hypothetical protein